MTSATKNVKLGTCNVLFDGRDLGLTKGGVEVEVATSTHEIMVDQYGSTPIGELITGRTVSATVPLAETTLDNLMAIMPGSTLVTDGEFATGTVTFSTAAPSAGNKIELFGQTYIYKANPNGEYELAVPATVEDAAEGFADAINGSVMPIYASAAGGVTTLTAEQRGVDNNVSVTATGANIAAVDLTGGVDVTSARVRVSTGVNINLLDIAKELKLRPIGTKGADDFIINRAACPGALSFTYNVEQERIYTAAFKGYIDDDGTLFSVGEETAA